MFQVLYGISRGQELSSFLVSLVRKILVTRVITVLIKDKNKLFM